jgi:hypothetical protein
MASASRLNLSFRAALSSCDVPGCGDGPPLALGNGASEGSMLVSSVRGFRMDDIALGRCGTGWIGTEDGWSWSIEVALRLRFLGEGALECAFEGVESFWGCEVLAVLVP